MDCKYILWHLPCFFIAQEKTGDSKIKARRSDLFLQTIFRTIIFLPDKTLL